MIGYHQSELSNLYNYEAFLFHLNAFQLRSPSL